VLLQTTSFVIAVVGVITNNIIDKKLLTNRTNLP